MEPFKVKHQVGSGPGIRKCYEHRAETGKHKAVSERLNSRTIFYLLDARFSIVPMNRHQSQKGSGFQTLESKNIT